MMVACIVELIGVKHREKENRMIGRGVSRGVSGVKGCWLDW